MMNKKQLLLEAMDTIIQQWLDIKYNDDVLNDMKNNNVIACKEGFKCTTLVTMQTCLEYKHVNKMLEALEHELTEYNDEE